MALKSFYTDEDLCIVIYQRASTFLWNFIKLQGFVNTKLYNITIWPFKRIQNAKLMPEMPSVTPTYLETCIIIILYDKKCLGYGTRFLQQLVSLDISFL